MFMTHNPGGAWCMVHGAVCCCPDTGVRSYYRSITGITEYYFV